MLAVREKRSEFERQAIVHTDALYGAAYRLTRNARDAEDLVQDSLLRAYRFWDSFEQDSNCKAWLLRIVTNTFINEYQRKKRSREVLDAATAEQDATDGVLIHADANERQSPERALLDRSVSGRCPARSTGCPRTSAPPSCCATCQGLSYKEIAEIMQTPVGTVMSRLFRGRKPRGVAARLRPPRGLHAGATPTRPGQRPREGPGPGRGDGEHDRSRGVPRGPRG